MLNRLSEDSVKLLELNVNFQFESRNEGPLNLVPAKNLKDHVHPKTGDTDKYFLGDRFHEANVRVFKDKSIQNSH